MNYNKNNLDLSYYITFWQVFYSWIDFGVFFAVTLLAL